MKYSEQKRSIVEYFLKSEKAPENFLIGAELEYFVVDKGSLKSVSYYQKNGIKDLLGTLVQKGFSPTFDGSDIVGAVNSFLAITLEPGAQFEISLNPQKELHELEKKYLEFLQIIEPILSDRDQKLHSSGYHPITRIDDIKFIPKKRYQYMSEYLKNRGKLALNMMKGTASIQVAVDFFSEQDFVQKMLLASRLTPILSAVYDNSPVFEGKPYKGYCLRTQIWNNCDNDRCGMIPQVFLPDFGYERYAEYILDLIPIIIVQNNKLISYEKPYKDIFDPLIEVEVQLNHIFSMCFPDVRARNYIELRMTDSLPYPLNFAFLELIDSVFYEKKVFEKVFELLTDITLDDIDRAKRESIRMGISAKLRDEKIINYFRKIIDIIGSKESEHFKLNYALAEKGKILHEMH